METLYFYALVICAGLAFLLVIFGDIFHFDGAVDPMLLVPWVAFVSLFGYIAEHLTAWDHLLIFIVGSLFSGGLVFLMNFYILLPVKNAQASISISERDMEGNVAQVTVPIPVKGMGEIQLKSVTGSMNRPAAFYQPQTAPSPVGQRVLIIEVKERVCYVMPYEETTEF